MKKFYPTANQFWLDDQPIFIHAGEFHYFRTPQDQWRHRLQLLKDAGFNTLATYIPWIWHQLEEGVSDFDGHSHPMRNLEGFLDLVTEMDFLIIPRPGPYIMAETINEGIPPWVFQNYPQVSYMSQDQKIQNIASYMHPHFLSCVSNWYKAIFSVLTPRQISRGGNIIMIQLDNEMGMVQWVRNIMDTNPHTMLKFANYLRETYGEQLPTIYHAQNLEEFLTNCIIHPQVESSKIVVDDYKRFYRGYIREYTAFLWSEAKTNGMEVLPVINIHGFANNGKTFPIGLSQLIMAMRMEGMISAIDVYPNHISTGNFHELLLVNEMTKTLQNKEQPLFSIEFQSGGHGDFSTTQASLYDLYSRLCISSGLRAINHYLFFGGENDPILSPQRRHDWGPPVRPNGTLRKHYHRYPKLSGTINAYGTGLVNSSPETVTTIGFLLDYFMTEVNNVYTQEFTYIITHQRDIVLFDMIARGLSITHRPFDALELSSAELNIERTPNLWIMMEQQCDAEAQQKLVDYIQAGGKLVLAGRMCFEDFSHQPCSILRDALGINQINTDKPFIDKSIRVFDYEHVPVSFVETYEGEFDQVIAEDKNGKVVGFVKSIGKGKVIVFGAAIYTENLQDIDIIHQIALMVDCLPLFTLSDWVDIRISIGKNGSFLFINNYHDDPVGTTIQYREKMLFGGNEISLPARTGMILPINWKINDQVFLHYSTAEVISIDKSPSSIMINLSQKEFYAEISLAGFHPNLSLHVQQLDRKDRYSIYGDKGVFILDKDE